MCMRKLRYQSQYNGIKFTQLWWIGIGLIKVSQEMAILRFDLENVISVCVKNWVLNKQSAFADK